MKKKILLLITLGISIILLSSLVLAEITTITPNIVNPGDTISLRVKPTKAGFYNIIYIYKDTNLIDLINVPCDTICTKLQNLYYQVPLTFSGEYYFATFDYAIENYELDYFTVNSQNGTIPEPPPTPTNPSTSALTIDFIGNAESGFHQIINPEQGTNANIKISVSVKEKGCDSADVYAYLCNSTLLTTCNSTDYNHKIQLPFQNLRGQTCEFTAITSDYFPFYQKPDNWKLVVEAGAWIANVNFTYTALAAINYTSAINFGSLNARVWNTGVPSSPPVLINYGNVPLHIEWTSNGFQCISENCTDFWQVSEVGEERFQIDDDISFMEPEINETGLIPVFITNHSLDFFPQENLSVCISQSCNDAQGESTLTYFNLKIPEIQRGIYEGDIVITLY